MVFNGRLRGGVCYGRGAFFFGPTGRDQTYVPQGEPTFRKGGGAQGGGKSAGVPGAGVGRVRCEEGVQGGGVDSDEQRGVEKPLPPGLVPSQGDQAFGALKALVLVRGPEKGSQVMGLVEGSLPQKPASPVPTTPTHAEMVARLHEFYDSEKKVSKRVEEAKGRLEKAGSLVMEEEERMAKVDGELEGIKDQIKALLKGEEERKERRRREEEVGGDDMEDSAFVEEAGSSEEVGVRVEVGKRRKVAKQGRLGGFGRWKIGC